MSIWTRTFMIDGTCRTQLIKTAHKGHSFEHSQCSACEKASSQLFMTMISKQNLKSINVRIFYYRPLVMMIEIH